MKNQWHNITKNVFIIAELSANHNNDFELAVKTIAAMAAAGADAVKVQTYTADSLTLNVDNELFGPRKEGLWKGLTPYEVFSQGSMPYDWQPKLKKVAEDLGLIFFSSPFDKGGVDFLESMNVPMYKVASLEINDFPLVRHIISKGKPIIFSTGAASFSDIEKIVSMCRHHDNSDIALLKCTSEYPATVETANLMTIPDMKKAFQVTVGVSDHTMGATVPVVAVALGAKIVEKHFILDRSLGGPDSAFSMEPHEFAAMVKQIRETEKALGVVDYTLKDKDRLRRRSLFAAQDIKNGEIFTSENVRSVRPGHGLDPEYLPIILGKSAARDILRGTPISLEVIVGGDPRHKA